MQKQAITDPLRSFHLTLSKPALSEAEGERAEERPLYILQNLKLSNKHFNIQIISTPDFF